MATESERSRDFVNMYEDREGKFRWQRKSRNGDIIGDSGQGYVDKEFMERMARYVNSEVTDFRWIVKDAE